MVLCNIYIPANTTIFPVDVRAKPKALLLPEASTNQGRILTFRDQFGACSTNLIAISTTGADRLDGNRLSTILNKTNGSVSFVSDGSNNWRQIGFYDGSVTSFLSTPATPLAFSPTCSLWLDATDPDTIIQSGGAITNWLDKSGNGNDATAYGSPTLTTINNRPAVQLDFPNNFDGSISATSNITVFAVATNQGTSNFYYRLVSLATIGGSEPGDQESDEFVVPLFTPFQVTAIGGVRNVLQNPTYSAGIQSVQPNVPFLACSVWTNGAIEMYVNGSNKVASNYSWKNGFSFSNYAVGRDISPPYTDGNNPIFGWPGPVGEVIVYGSALSAVQRQQVEGYLAWKWNLQSNLPPFHLYKNYPPISPESPLSNNAIVTYGLDKNVDAAYYNFVNGSNWLALNGTFMALSNRPSLNLSPGGQTVLTFNGSNQYAMDQAGTTATTNYSIDVWFYPTAANGTVVSELGQQGTPFQGYRNAVLQLVNGFARVGFYTGGIRNFINLGPISLNTWNQVSWTYDGGTLRGYVNGFIVNSGNLSKNPPTRSYYAVGAGTVGSNFGTNNYFKGSIGSFKFYTSVLNDSQVLQNYQAFASNRYDLSANPSPPGVSWSSNLDGNGSTTDNGDGNWSIVGPNDSDGAGWSYIYTQFLTSGNFTYGYSYTTSDSPGYDWLFDTVSSSPLSNPANVNFNNKVASFNGDSGNRNIFYNVGDWVAIGVYSTDSTGGTGIASLTGIPGSNIPPAPPISSIASPLDIPNCAIWFDPTNAESIRLQEGTASTVVGWSNLGLEGGVMMRDTNSVFTSSFTINTSTSMYFPSQARMAWSGSIQNQEKTTFYVIETNTNPILAFFPNYTVFAGTDYQTVQVGASINNDNPSFSLCRAGDWCMYGSSNVSFFDYPQLISMRITQDLAQNILNGNTSTLTLLENYQAERFNNSFTTYYTGHADSGTTMNIGDILLYDRALTDEEVSLVENYLLKKWSINSTSPPAPTTLGIWFDASDLSSLTWDENNNYRVTTWSNKGLIGNVAYVSPYGTQSPQTRLNSQNGLNVVSFNTTTTDDLLYMNPFSLQSGDKTCVLVLKLNEPLGNPFDPFAPTKSIPFLQAQNGFNFGDFSFVMFWDGNASSNFIGTVNGGYCFPTYGLLPSIDGQYVLITLVAVQNPESPNVGVWLNGSNYGNTYLCASENNGLPIEYFLGGASGNFGPSYDLAEMRIYFESFGTSERQTLEGELAWKWGIEASLPNDHPYRFAPP